MNKPSFNWQIWAGFLLSIAAFLTYPFVFVRFEITRDFPWANLAMFAVAMLFVGWGFRRALAGGRRTLGKIVGVVVGVLSVAILGMFIFAVFVFARQLPPSTGAPHVGQKAPDFTLTDTKGQSVSLAQLLSEPVKGQPPKGVLMIFYRGYW